MGRNVATTVMEEYEKQFSLYSAFTEKVEKLIRDLIRANDLRVLSVTSRVKARASVQMKLARSERKLAKLCDVPDISGSRIITYFADDVDSVAKVIEKEFDVDKKQSVDKRELLDPDRFGYLSLHYVVKLSTARAKLTEYRRFTDCLAEIQIRSILQHAWAEIEHDLGYKGKYAVPREIRRRFSRLAGLLEIADVEFAKIRDNLREYEKKVPKQIIEAPASVLIDKASLLSFIRTSSLVHELDRKIASIAESVIVENDYIVNSLVKELKYVGIDTIAELDDSLHKSGETAINFAEMWMGSSRHETISAGISLYYLSLVLIGSRKSLSEACSYLATFHIGEDYMAIAENLISVYSKVASE